MIYHAKVKLGYGKQDTLHYCNTEEKGRDWKSRFQWLYGYWPEDWQLISREEVQGEITVSEFNELKNRVVKWAREHAADDYHYGSPYSYWRVAKDHGIITEEEFSVAAKRYGNMWHYRGD